MPVNTGNVIDWGSKPKTVSPGDTAVQHGGLPTTTEQPLEGFAPSGNAPKAVNVVREGRGSNPRRTVMPEADSALADFGAIEDAGSTSLKVDCVPIDIPGEGFQDPANLKV